MSPEEAKAAYLATRSTFPLATDLARYVAQLERWADEEPEGSDQPIYRMVACHLRTVMGPLADVIMPEAARRDAEATRPRTDRP